MADFAVSELIADKLPFTPSRLKAGPLASRIVSGAVCGAAIYGVVEQPLQEGAVLGGLGAIAGAFAGYHMRKRLSRDIPAALRYLVAPLIESTARESVSSTLVVHPVLRKVVEAKPVSGGKKGRKK